MRTRHRIPLDYGDVPKNTTGTVTSLDGDWAVVKLPEGRRFETHVLSLSRLDRAQDL